MSLALVKQQLKKISTPERAAVSRRFFKTGLGQYGHGDVFIGVTVPDLRALSKAHAGLSLKDLCALLTSPIHEERLLSLLILIIQFNKADETGRKSIYDFYLKYIRHINNWDLIDLSAERIIGAFLLDKPKGILYTLAKSGDLWERRIAMMSTFEFIKQKQFDDALKIAGILLHDKHDLIQKAAGWMLREIGKRDLRTEEHFLKHHAHEMPRTMLRYAVERFPEQKRRSYLKQKGA